MPFFKEAHVSIFSGRTRCGKTHRVLDLLETEYKGIFDYVIIIAPTLRWNKTYLERKWLRTDDCVFLVEPKDNLEEILTTFSNIFAGVNTLFILDDLISDEEMSKQRGIHVELAATGRHKNHSIWVLTQRYKRVPITIRDQAEQLFIWYPKSRGELELIHDENEVFDSREELKEIRKILKNTPRACLFLRAEPPVEWKIITNKCLER